MKKPVTNQEARRSINWNSNAKIVTILVNDEKDEIKCTHEDGTVTVLPKGNS